MWKSSIRKNGEDVAFFDYAQKRFEAGVYGRIIGLLSSVPPPEADLT